MGTQGWHTGTRRSLTGAPSSKFSFCIWLLSTLWPRESQNTFHSPWICNGLSTDTSVSFCQFQRLHTSQSLFCLISFSDTSLLPWYFQPGTREPIYFLLGTSCICRVCSLLLHTSFPLITLSLRRWTTEETWSVFTDGPNEVPGWWVTLPVLRSRKQFRALPPLLPGLLTAYVSLSAFLSVCGIFAVKAKL